MNCGDSAGQIFVFDIGKADFEHHFHQTFLIGKTRNRFGQIFIRAARTADYAADFRQNLCEIKLKNLPKTRNDRRGKFQNDEFSVRF